VHGAHHPETAKSSVPDKTGAKRRQSAATAGEGLQQILSFAGCELRDVL